MATSRTTAHARRAADRVQRALAEDVRRLREDAGLSRRALGIATGVDPSFLGRLEDGHARGSLETYARLGVGLGADLGAHLYPTTGPLIRDRHQARIVEALLKLVHGRWRAYPEVAVRRPARGWIDLVLHDSSRGCLLAIEVQSQLLRLEQLVRWSTDKAASIESWDGYSHLGPIATQSRLLIVRSTRATREIAGQFAGQLHAAYPAHPGDALAALTGTDPWPGPALIWIDLRSESARFLARR